MHVVGFVSPVTALNAYLRKYDPSGNEAWTRQLSQARIAQGVAVDAAGDVYIVGFVVGALPGQTSAGLGDAYVRKYDSDGNVVWTRQFGSSAFDSAASVGTDAAGNVYIAGNTLGALPGQTSAGSMDAFVRVYDSAGSETWTRQFGSSTDDGVRGVAADQAGNVFVSGSTMGALPGQTSAGSFDAFIRKYDSAGVEAWTDQFGSSAACPGYNGFDGALDVAAGPSGTAFLVGAVVGPLPGQIYVGGGDAFVRKYSARRAGCCGACRAARLSPTPRPALWWTRVAASSICRATRSVRSAVKHRRAVLTTLGVNVVAAEPVSTTSRACVVRPLRPMTPASTRISSRLRLKKLEIFVIEDKRGPNAVSSVFASAGSVTTAMTRRRPPHE